MSASKIDLRGQWFHRLFALRPVSKDDPRNKLGVLAWFCLCRCGKRVLARTGQLRKAQIKSCGCLLVETRLRNGKKIGRARRGVSRINLGDSEYIRGAVFREEQRADAMLQEMELTAEFGYLLEGNQ